MTVLASVSKIFRNYTLIACVLAASSVVAQAQPTSAHFPSGAKTTGTPAGRSSEDTLASMTALRDAFIARVKTKGFTCTLQPPPILVEDVPSFGQYNYETNTLRTSDWTLLNPRECAFFTQLAGPGATEVKAQTFFEAAAHHWIFIHELGHWWEACTGVDKKQTPWEAELNANRVSLAYWREVDPAIVAFVEPVFQSVVDHAPSPLPAGDEMKTYFNKHYQALGPSPAYPWFMSQMNVAAFQEVPQPAFAEVLRSIGAVPAHSSENAASPSCASINPDAQDGVLVAPENHHVLFENADVRVIEVSGAPHAKEVMHTHNRPSIFYLDAPTATRYVVAGDEAHAKVRRGPPPDFKPIVISMPPEALHAVESLSDRTFHALRVELKHPGCDLLPKPAVTPDENDAVAVAPANYKVLFENLDVRVIDVIIAPHAKEPMHTHPWGGFVYFVQAGQMQTVGADGKLEGIKTVPGKKIVPAEARGLHATENLSDTPLHEVRFELKHGSEK